MDRARLPDVVVERIRRERYDPRKTQFDYLHLRDLKAQLQAAFARLPNVSGPGLDLFCGTQPYREMIPVKPVWGLDLIGISGGRMWSAACHCPSGATP